MRLTLVIAGLTLIAVALVHLRREDYAVRHRIQQIESEHARLRREIWDRQVELGELTTPQAIRHREKAMALGHTTQDPVEIYRPAHSQGQP